MLFFFFFENLELPHLSSNSRFRHSPVRLGAVTVMSSPCTAAQAPEASCVLGVTSNVDTLLQHSAHATSLRPLSHSDSSTCTQCVSHVFALVLHLLTLSPCAAKQDQVVPTAHVLQCVQLLQDQTTLAPSTARPQQVPLARPDSGSACAFPTVLVTACFVLVTSLLGLLPLSAHLLQISVNLSQ